MWTISLGEPGEVRDPVQADLIYVRFRLDSGQINNNPMTCACHVSMSTLILDVARGLQYLYAFEFTPGIVHGSIMM